MLEWIKVLSLQTKLTEDNERIERAEGFINASSYLKAQLEESDSESEQDKLN